MSAPWRDDIRTVIENSAKFIFVISPDSVASEPCAFELAQATGMAKQVITILWRDPRPLPPETDQKTAACRRPALPRCPVAPFRGRCEGRVR